MSTMNYRKGYKRPRVGSYALSLMGGVPPNFGKKFFKRRPYAVSGSAKLSKPMREAITNVIKRREEIKVVYDANTAQVGNANNNTNWNSNGFIALLPNTGSYTLGQGTGKSDRLGDSVTVRKLMCDLVLYPLPYDVTTNVTVIPQDVMVCIISSKRTPVTNIVQAGGTTGATTLADIFIANDGSQTFTGTLGDVFQPFNTDAYTIHHKEVVKLAWASFTGAAGNDGTRGYYANNDYKMNALVSIDCTKFCPTKLHWQDNTAPSLNKQLYLMVCPMPANNANPIAANLPIAYVQRTTLKYCDV